MPVMSREALDGSLAAARPDLADEADGWDPSTYRPGSRANLPWRCADCGTSWSTEIRNRIRGFAACPTCHRNSHPPLAVTHPGIAGELLPPYDPTRLTHGSKEKVWWRGPRGHVWQAAIANRAKGSGCPVCAKGAGGRARQVPPPGLSLAELRADIADEADGWDPRCYRTGSSARLPWRCASCGHEWAATVYRRTHGQGCPACAAGKVIPLGV